jgi:hypothetical protein
VNGSDSAQVLSRGGRPGPAGAPRRGVSALCVLPSRRCRASRSREFSQLIIVLFSLPAEARTR